MEITYNCINNIFLKEIESKFELDLDIKMKKLYIEEVTNTYYDKTGNMPPNKMLYVLTEWFLEDELKNKSPHKITNEEYPILSKYQIKRRLAKHPVIEGDILDHLSMTGGRKNKKVSKSA